MAKIEFLYVANAMITTTTRQSGDDEFQTHIHIQLQWSTLSHTHTRSQTSLGNSIGSCERITISGISAKRSHRHL